MDAGRGRAGGEFGGAGRAAPDVGVCGATWGTPTRLPFGRVGDVAYGPGGSVVLQTRISVEPAWWKRYRGGTAGRLWVDPAGGGEFGQILSDVDASLVSPMWVGERLAFLSDMDGVGSVYSCLPDGSDLRRHTEQEFYARNAATDGTRVVYHSAGDLWMLDSLDAEPRKLEVRLGGSGASRQAYPISARWALGDAAPDYAGRGGGGPWDRALVDQPGWARSGVERGAGGTCPVPGRSRDDRPRHLGDRCGR
ncbi:hypothetical protein GCM10029964_006590 [Kibdelosporangium lantanae]